MSDFTKEFLDSLSKKQDMISGDIVEMKITQAKQEVNLAEHMKRSDLLERSQERLFSELEPIKNHVSRVDGALKLIGIISVLISIASGILKILQAY